MTCLETRRWLSAFHDGELDVVTDSAVREHLAGCPECRSELESLRSLSGSIYRLERSPASDDLRRRVAGSIGIRQPARFPWGWLIAFGAGAAATLAVIGVLIPRVASSPESITREILDSHVAALMSEHPVDVVSSDRHTVKPWFVGKVTISPTPWDLSGFGFPLVGGRVAVVEGKACPVFVYKRRKHWIDLFVLSSPGSNWTLSRQGYNMMAWPSDGLEYVAVSDVDASDLRIFNDAFRKQPSTPGG